MEWLILALLGSIVGLLAGLFGIGGGLILVPILAWLLPALQLTTPEGAMSTAIATTLASVAITGAAASWTHFRQGKVDWQWVKRLLPSLTIGAVVGALLTQSLPTALLAAIFGICEILIALQMALVQPRSGTDQSFHPLKHHGFGFLSGSISALIGIGGGTLNTPWLMWHGTALPIAIATSSMLGVIIAISGTMTHIHSDLINLWVLFALISTSLITAPIGARLTHRLPVKQLKRHLAWLIFILGVVMCWQAWLAF